MFCLFAPCAECGRAPASDDRISLVRVPISVTSRRADAGGPEGGQSCPQWRGPLHGCLAGIGQPAVRWWGDGFWVFPIAPRPRNVVRRHDLQDDVEEVFDIVSIGAIVRGGGRVDPRIPAISRVRPHSGAL